MNLHNIKLAAVGVVLMAAATSSNAAIIITEVDPTGSSNTNYAADWFELSNTGTVAQDITNWKMDDNSGLFANAVALRGVTSIAAGQSVVFIEGNATGTTDSTINANFKSAWFGANTPTGLTIGNYGGSGVGLSSTADAVNIFNAAGTLVAAVSFGASTLTGGTFDNSILQANSTTALTSGATLTQFSTAGLNGAFVSALGSEIGSPGTISAVPVPAAVWLFGSALIGMTSFARKKKSA
jgi:hypothetical protein